MRSQIDFWTYDNNGRRAVAGFFLRDDTPPELALSFANLLRGPFLALTQNRLVGGYYRINEQWSDAEPAQPGADSRRSATLFYSNVENSARLVLPSPAPGLAELAGPFAGFRITRESAQLAGKLATIEALISGAVLIGGDPWPETFDIGVLDERE